MNLDKERPCVAGPFFLPIMYSGQKYLRTPSWAREASALMETVNFTPYFSEKDSSQSRNTSTSGLPSVGTILLQTLDEHVGNVVVTGVQAVHKALQVINRWAC